MVEGNGHKARLDDTNRRLETMDTQVRKHSHAIGGLQNGQDGIREDIKELKDDIGSLEASVADVNKSVAVISTRLKYGLIVGGMVGAGALGGGATSLAQFFMGG